VGGFYERRLNEHHADDLTLDQILDMLVDGLRARSTIGSTQPVSHQLEGFPSAKAGKLSGELSADRPTPRLRGDELGVRA